MNTHSNEEMRDLLSSLKGVIPATQIILLGSEFSFPDEEYIRNLGARYDQFLLDNNLSYELGSWDCSQFSLALMNHASLEHATYGPQGTKMAIGIVGLVYERGVHVMCFAFHSTGDSLYVKLYEPQLDNGLCLIELPLSSVGTYLFFYL